MLHILPGEEKREVGETHLTGKSEFQKAKLAKLKVFFLKFTSRNVLYLIWPIHH